MRISTRSQIGLVWWALAWGVIYALALGFLLRMIPPPDADQPAEQVAAWYREHANSIRIGATLTSYVSAFLVPLWVVIAMQIHRLERGRPPVWTTLAALGGATMAIFLVLPPIFWGVAAFSPERPVETTRLMHQLGVLTFVTTDQFYVFGYVAVIAACFLPQTAPHSPFPRWFGYYNIFATLVFEAGAIAFNFKSGPFSWKGLVPYWIPMFAVSTWIILMSYMLLKGLRRQRDDDAVAAPSPVLSAHHTS